MGFFILVFSGRENFYIFSDDQGMIPIVVYKNINCPRRGRCPAPGYWSAGNVRAMGSAGIRFLTGPEPDVRPHERVVAERLGGIHKTRNLVAHGGRHSFLTLSRP